jgi:acetyltransferase-like isoleucine patch superfamily enzyme
MSKKVVIIGGEGHGGGIASCIEDNRNRYGDYEWEVVGFINDYDKTVLGYPVIGCLSDIPKFIEKTDYYFSWAIHLIGRNYKTYELFMNAKIPDDRLATVIHRSAFIGSNTVLEPGVSIMYNVFIGANALIRKCALIKPNSSITHNSEIGFLSHCAVNSKMGGNSRLGNCCDLAMGATLLPQKSIGDFSMLGANSVGSKNIPEGEIWQGLPARYLKRMNRE